MWCTLGRMGRSVCVVKTIEGILLAHREREDRARFAREKSGFVRDRVEIARWGVGPVGGGVKCV